MSLLVRERPENQGFPTATRLGSTRGEYNFNVSYGFYDPILEPTPVPAPPAALLLLVALPCVYLYRRHVRHRTAVSPVPFVVHETEVEKCADSASA